jgi:hypothetical protein
VMLGPEVQDEWSDTDLAPSAAVTRAPPDGMRAGGGGACLGWLPEQGPADWSPRHPLTRHRRLRGSNSEEDRGSPPGHWASGSRPHPTTIGTAPRRPGACTRRGTTRRPHVALGPPHLLLGRHWSLGLEANSPPSPGDPFRPRPHPVWVARRRPALRLSAPKLQRRRAPAPRISGVAAGVCSGPGLAQLRGPPAASHERSYRHWPPFVKSGAFGLFPSDRMTCEGIP